MAGVDNLAHGLMGAVIGYCVVSAARRKRDWADGVMDVYRGGGVSRHRYGGGLFGRDVFFRFHRSFYAPRRMMLPIWAVLIAWMAWELLSGRMNFRLLWWAAVWAGLAFVARLAGRITGRNYSKAAEHGAAGVGVGIYWPGRVRLGDSFSRDGGGDLVGTRMEVADDARDVGCVLFILRWRIAGAGAGCLRGEGDDGPNRGVPAITLTRCTGRLCAMTGRRCTG